MNVFEDLVVELKEANLLESTVIDSSGMEGVETDSLSSSAIVEPAGAKPAQSAPEKTPAKKAENDLEFFRKKAIGEVASLQMVEHVVTGVEREYMKVVPRVFDDLNAKLALNAFVNSDSSVQSQEHKTAEFELMTQTEAWCSALALRDREVSVTALRQYCERSRPALSSQALLALGRFYRNLPYSEPVRAKFDFVITRLFSRSTANEKRICLFERGEMLGHINTLYSDWSSISLYSVDDDDTNVRLTALSFDDLAAEAEAAENFDSLVASDFFGRLRMFKESISDLFYAPEVTCAAISANIRIGNAYVELIDRERKKLDSRSIQNRYEDHDVEVSETTGKTLQLARLLKQLDAAKASASERPASEPKPARNPRPETPRPEKKAAPAKYTPAAEKGSDGSFIVGLKTSVLAVNKWLLIASAVLIAAALGFYLWTGSAPEETATTAGVKVFEVENTILKEHLKTARISGETFYAQVDAGWDSLPRDKRQEFLQKVYQAAAENGCKQVSLIGAGGKSVGYATATQIEVATP